MKITLNLSDPYIAKKKKMIKKNNGYCIGCPKTPEWKCPCKAFREKTTSGFCGEGLYYKDMEAEDEADTDGETAKEETL